MSDANHSTNDKTLSQSAWEEIHAIRDQFKQDLNAGKTIRLEDYLQSSWPHEQRMVLKHRLAVVEQAAREADKTTPIQEHKARQQMCHAEVKPDQTGGLTAHSTRPVRRTNPGMARHIGPYKLLQLIGEGGMGAVWMAQQETPVRRRVALKLVKEGFCSKEVLARFEAERQALAMMDHENIAKVLHAGMSQDGQPYFAMELVQGIPFTEYCDKNRLSPEERLRLFVPVCRAIQHAHHKGIIHRDIKPSNVLVTFCDGRAVPKVIDFGLAKALQHQTKLTDKTIFTEFGKVIGTLNYMSPEQAEANPLDVDTRTDIYSLGVMLYELLTGSTPLEKQTARKQALLSVLRSIREDEPPRPSQRLSLSSGSGSEISQRRNIDPSRLHKILQGELDWIVMKALDKDRTRRYQTANDFCEDLERYLVGDPVAARAPSFTYRVSKLVKKYRGLVLTAVTTVLCLFSALAISIFFWLRAERNEQRARLQHARTELINQFYEENVLAAVRPTGWAGGRGKDLLLKAALDAASNNINSTFAKQPDLEARVRDSLGMTYYYLGEFVSAKPHLENAYNIRRLSLGENDVDTLKSLHNLSMLRWKESSLREAIRLSRDALERRKRRLGVEHQETLFTQLNLGLFLSKDMQYEEAEVLLRDAIERCQRILGSDHEYTLYGQNDLANLLSETGRIKEAIALDRLTLDGRRRTLGTEHAATLRSMNNLANKLITARQLEEAESLINEALEGRTRILGENHLETSWSIASLASLRFQQGRSQEAVQIWRDVVEDRVRTYGVDHEHTAAAQRGLAHVLRQIGQLNEAETILRNLLAALATHRGKVAVPKSLDATRFALAQLLVGDGRFGDAEREFRTIVQARRQIYGQSSVATVRAQQWLAFVLKERGKREQAKATLQEMIEALRGRSPRSKSDLASSLLILGDLFVAEGRAAEAEPLLREALQLRKLVEAPRSKYVANAMASVGKSLVEQGKLAEAEPLLLNAYERLVTDAEASEQHVNSIVDSLIKLYQKWERSDQVHKWSRAA